MAAQPEVTVVIPCYNQGKYLLETLHSVASQTFTNLDIVIVNDGSSDPVTISVLERLQIPNVEVIHTVNQGVSVARNTGIEAATGRYILPLDADDYIGPEYIAKSVQILDAMPIVGFVYCLGRLFGAARGMFILNKATCRQMLLDSRVFCSALFRKSDWAAVGGYNPNMIFGWEDWDFWLSLIELGKEPFLIEDVMFFYRVRPKSRTRSMTFEHKVAMHRQLYENHRELYRQADIDPDFEKYHRLRESLGGKITDQARKIAFNIRYWDK
jgi:glycosyltransferase involved in cell wall biosynthesis